MRTRPPEKLDAQVMFRCMFLSCLVLMSGCVHDISHVPHLKTDYVVGGVYRVKRPLVLHGRALYDPVAVPKAKGAVVALGTSVQVSRLQLEHRDWIEGRIIWIHALIVDGPLAGKPADLAYVPQMRGSNAEVPMLDTNILEFVRTK
jgi:hypothetical protein